MKNGKPGIGVLGLGNRGVFFGCRAFVEGQSFTVAEKANMMVDHFHEQVIAKGKIGGEARAMVCLMNGVCQ